LYVPHILPGEVPDGASVKYTVTSTPNLPTDITLDETTGVITIGATAVVQTEMTYTIQATGQGNYDKTKTADVKIKITPRNIAGYALTYATTSVVYGTGGIINPPTSPFPTEASVTYAIKTDATSYMSFLFVPPPLFLS
jgi:hypothetical protein